MMTRSAKTKGPAATAIAPDLGPTTPLKGTANMETNTSSATAAIDPRGPKTFDIDMAALAAMPCEDLWHVQDAIAATCGVLSAYLGQPRYQGDEGAGMTAAGAYLEKLMQVLDSVSDGIANAACAASPTDEREILWRAWVLIQWHAGSADDMHEVAAIASEALRDGRAAEMNARRIAFDTKRGIAA